MNQRHLTALLQSNFYTVAVVFDRAAQWDNRGAVPQAPQPAQPRRQPVAQVAPEYQDHSLPQFEKSYTFKCPDDIKLVIGDKVLVDSPKNGITVATVVRVDDFADIDLNADFTYKWLVQKVDRVRYDTLVDQETQFNRLLVEAERVKQREATLQSFRTNLPESGAARELFEQALGMFNPQSIHKDA